MKNLFKASFIALFATFALGASAAIVNVSVDGITTDTGQGDAGNTVIVFDLAAALGLASGSSVTVDGFGWDITLTPEGPSWYSEPTIGFVDSVDGLSLSPGAGAGGGDVAGNGVPVQFLSGGIVDLSDNGFTDIVLSNGLLTLEFYEGFDDSTVSPDALWAGFLEVSADATVVPVPAALWLMISAFGGLAAMRKRS